MAVPRPSWLRFRLRTLLIVMSICCVAIALWLQRAEQQRRAAEALRARGARVFYSYEYRGGDFVFEEPAVPDYLLRKFGPDLFYPAVAVEMGAYFHLDTYDRFPGETTYDPDFHLDDKTWANLKALPLEFLSLNACNLSNDDLRHVAEMRRLKSLQLETVPIDGNGLRHLARLPKLETLSLHRCGITDETLDGLLELTTLHTLGLQETRLTPAACQRVHQSLRGCKVYD